MATIVTGDLTNEVKTYYEAKFLERAKYEMVHAEGSRKNTHPKGEGKTIRFNRYSPLAAATSPLSEGQNPSEGSISASSDTVTLAEYGAVIKVSKLLKLTSIDVDAKEKVELLGQNMGETMDILTREALYGGATVVLAGGKTQLSNVAASDVFNTAEIRKAVRTLETNKARKYADGFFIGKVGPSTKYDLLGDNTWINAKTYSDVKDLYEGEMGELHGVRFLNVTEQKSEDSTTTVYSNFIHGDFSFGTYDLEGDRPQLYIKVPNDGDTSNPTNRYSTIGWAGTYAAKVLVASWVLNVKSGATA